MAIRVLTVDDDSGFTYLVKLNLERVGDFIVLEENDPSYAVSAALEFEPDIVLLDVVMPGISGNDVAAMFKNYPKLKNTPVLLITALLSPQEARERSGSDSAISRVLPKPVDIETLQTAIKETLGTGEET